MVSIIVAPLETCRISGEAGEDDVREHADKSV